MNAYEIFDEIQDVINILDADECPEIHHYFEEIMNSDETVTEDPYEIANRLLLLDRNEPLPPVVRELIIELFQTAFERGNPEAMNDLGALYYDGSRGFELDFKKAVEYYDIAAQNGSRQAGENLGYCYYYGRDVPVDYEKAFHYFALGAFDGHLISLYKIGDMYQNGYYVQKNETEAFHIYDHCASSMTEESAKFVAGPVFLRLGKCFLNGIGTRADAETALICYQKAEVFLFDMVKHGDKMYKKSLQTAIDGQAMARKQLTDHLEQVEWGF